MFKITLNYGVLNDIINLFVCAYSFFCLIHRNYSLHAKRIQNLQGVKVLPWKL